VFSKNAIKSTTALIILFLLLTSLTCSVGAQEKPKPGGEFVGLLEKSGYSYTKVGDGLWEVPGTGKNLKEFGIRLALADDILLVMVRLAGRKEVKLEPTLLTKLLELNHKFDWVKLAISDEIVYLRMDTHLRLVDSQELKYLIEQIANATDETYPQIKPFLVGAK